MSKILIACEFSGIVREAFKKKGHDAYSCDLLDTEIPGQHIKGDVLNILNDGWDMMIAFDPCTYQCNSGVRWLYEILGRWELLEKSCNFTNKLLKANIKKIARENPIPHYHALKLIGRKYDQIIQPWQFGHGETKATCLWLKNLPKLIPANIVEGREHKIHKMPPFKNRGKKRSITYQGIAQGMADQWG